MRSVNLREAKASLSSLIDAAEHGESTTITKHGKPAAVIIPLDLAAKILDDKKPNFADFLMSAPTDIEFERNLSKGREFEF
jgi:prevent-host-death family protein